jgi:intergrase/recombinase
LTNALRKLFNFYEAQDLAPKEYLDKLRANFPEFSIGIDLKVPDEKQIIESYKQMSLVKDKRYFALYNLLLDSGLRLIEGVYLYNQILKGEVQIENHRDFSVTPLGYFRGTKLAYYGFITESTLQLIKAKSKPINYKKVIGTSKLGAVSWKYLRKFANDIMTSEKINIPESVSDFIEGRVPRSVGPRHYMQLKRKAIAFYPRYSKFMTELRNKASISL